MDDPVKSPVELGDGREQQEAEGESWIASLWTLVTSTADARLMRWLTHFFSIVLLFGMVWALRALYLNVQPVEQSSIPAEEVLAADLPTPTATVEPLPFPELVESGAPFRFGIPRYALLHTTIPTRPRVDVITYTVQVGDSVFGIAEKFGLRPETILWGNYDVLQDNPHVLRPDQVLNILPVDGTYHEWRAGENFRKVAEFYGVDPQVIVEWPGNRLDPFEFNIDDPQLEPGTMLIIPGGSRPLRDWGPPPIVRTNPAIASTYGPGFCGAIYEGAVGTGTFVWPTPLHYLSGYDYSPTIHPAIDIAGDYGHAIYATDNGVVVYAGWSNYGYGNLIVIDHGNGWQSLYAHLDSVQVGCGMSVFQGSIIGTMGSTGQSTGPHLHFELRHEQWGKVNPWNFLP
jgi:murein DD-endopeptidase MepM/ murein hydrolase activator NlpD